ncbi:hypothetical protein SAMN05660337_3469 [Maridesulfovibrio ferrireducens]|uniref:Uncharacterized protein n=1 Tax=Maridesulfovibrio ferrireducens TaxID=246191 RepID=A0A1G9LPW0_9BACT|nr:hypothetical protein [Maridesulfovibrio ferrireducens]SDL64079.1 hypothetical protein SAMN05660337_3469 [Maridesulfovibrio ferrireducens]
MKGKIPLKFLNSSKCIMKDDPEIFQKLRKVMGKVADSVVKDKYVEDINIIEKDYKEDDDAAE